MVGGPASSQPKAGSGSADPAPSPDDDDDEGGNGKGSAVVAPSNPALRAGWLKERFATALAGKPQLARAKVAYYAVDLSTGAVLVSHEADKGLNLASNAKLLTSVAALKGLGAGFRWRTSVHATALPDSDGKVTGNLYIKGRGDPVLGDSMPSFTNPLFVTK